MGVIIGGRICFKIWLDIFYYVTSEVLSGMRFIPLYFSDKAASLGYQLKKDKASRSNKKRKLDVKTFYAASLCAKHCSEYKEFVISGPMSSRKREDYNGDYNPYNSYQCSCVDGECEEVEDKQFKESTIYTITKKQGGVVFPIFRE